MKNQWRKYVLYLTVGVWVFLILHLGLDFTVPFHFWVELGLAAEYWFVLPIAAGGAALTLAVATLLVTALGRITLLFGLACALANVVAAGSFAYICWVVLVSV